MAALGEPRLKLLERDVASLFDERQDQALMGVDARRPVIADAARRRIASSFCPQRWRPTKRTLDGAHRHAHERRYDLAGGSVAFALISPGAFRRWRGRGVFAHHPFNLRRGQPFQRSGGDMFAALIDGTRPRAGKTHPPISGAPKSDVLHMGRRSLP
jgi:hypothetical protein